MRRPFRCGLWAIAVPLRLGPPAAWGGLYGRLELSPARQAFDISGTGAAPGLPGLPVKQDIVGANWRFAGDIGRANLDALVEVLQQAMDAQVIPFNAQNKLLAQLAPMHRDIVNLT